MSHEATESPLFQTILFATDLSDRSRTAFSVACSLAREGTSRLIIVHVEEPVPLTGQVAGFGDLGVPVYIPGADEGRLGALEEELRELFVPGTPIAVEFLVKRGHAAEEVLRIAEEVGCDLIVMATEGKTGLDRLLMGSVAESVMRRSACPALTIRASSSDAPSSGSFTTILHPTDFSRNSERALQVARALARDHGARLILVSVVPVETIPAAVSEVLVDLDHGHEALESLRTRVENTDLKLPVETLLMRGDPAKVILEAARETGSDLIVIGSHGRTGLGRLLMGSVAEAVMRGAPCPVLTVKSPISTAATIPLAASGKG